MKDLNKTLIDAISLRENSSKIIELLVDFLSTEEKERFLSSMEEQGFLPKSNTKLKVYNVLSPNDRRTCYLLAAKSKKEISLIFKCSQSQISELSNQVLDSSNEFLLAINNPSIVFEKEGRFKGEYKPSKIVNNFSLND